MSHVLSLDLVSICNHGILNIEGKICKLLNLKLLSISPRFSYNNPIENLLVGLINIRVMMILRMMINLALRINAL